MHCPWGQKVRNQILTLPIQRGSACRYHCTFLYLYDKSVIQMSVDMAPVQWSSARHLLWVSHSKSCHNARLELCPTNVVVFKFRWKIILHSCLLLMNGSFVWTSSALRLLQGPVQAPGVIYLLIQVLHKPFACLLNFLFTFFLTCLLLYWITALRIGFFHSQARGTLASSKFDA